MFLVSGGALLLLCLQRVVSASCPVEQLPCDSGSQCISSEEWCDNRRDCVDGSDEAYCGKSTFWNSYDPDPNECKSKVETHLICKSGICVPKIAECNGHEDCKDGSDEKNCGQTPTYDDDYLTYDDDFDHSSGEIESGISPPTSHFDSQTEAEEEIVPTAKVSRITPASQEKVTAGHDLTATYYDKRMKEAVSSAAPEIVTAPDVRRRETSKYSSPFQPTTPIPRGQSNNVSPITHRSSYPPFRPTTSIPRQRQSNHVGSIPISPNNHQLITSRRIRPPLFVNIPSTTNDGNRHPNVHRPLGSIQGSVRQDSYHGPEQHWDQEWRAYKRQEAAKQGYATRDSYHGPEQHWDREWRAYKRQGIAKKPFHFAKDYARLYGGVNANSLREGERWLMEQRSKVDDWGDNSGRALIALALTRNGFPSGDQEMELIKRRFMVKLGADLIRNSTKVFSVNRLSTSILALLAVCEDPQDFHGMDLTEVLRNKIQKRIQDRQFVNPNVYLSLCLSNRSLSMQEVNNLRNQMMPARPSHEMSKDMQSLAIQAFACYLQENSREDPSYRRSLQEILRTGVSSLLRRVDEDGSIGSVYSTALAAQALMSADNASNWDAARTMAFLREQQQEDGSFGDLLATYFTLPALSGRSTLHLRNIHCNETAEAVSTPSEALEFAGPKQYIHYSIYFGNPLANSHSIRVLVPNGISFLDVMKVAETQDANFRYAYEERDPLYVYSLSGLPNDPERELSWYLYVKQESYPHQKELNPRERYYGDLRNFQPRSFQHVIFWYHPTDQTRRKL